MDGLVAAEENLMTLAAKAKQEIDNLKSSLTARQDEMEAFHQLLVKENNEADQRASDLRVWLENLDRSRDEYVQQVVKRYRESGVEQF